MSFPLISFIIILCLSFLISKMLGDITRNRNILLDGGIPLVGGIAIISILVLTLFFNMIFLCVPHPFERIISISFWSLIILIFGVWDDWKAASILQKFSWQILCALGLLSSGIGIHFPLIGDSGSFILNLLWIVGLTNAFNLLDVSDGVCSVITLFAVVTVGGIATMTGCRDVALISSVLVPAILGSLFLNLPPARIYLGNAGSHCLGFILAALTLTLVGDVPSMSMVFSVLMILWLPVFETVCLVFFRFRKKINPLHKSDDHLALKFLGRGFTRQQVLLLMSAMAGLFSILGIFLYRSYTVPLAWFMAFLVVVVSIVMIFLLLLMEEHGA